MMYVCSSFDYVKQKYGMFMLVSSHVSRTLECESGETHIGDLWREPPNLGKFRGWGEVKVFIILKIYIIYINHNILTYKFLIPSPFTY